jgi:hypothetical protein
MECRPWGNAEKSQAFRNAFGSKRVANFFRGGVLEPAPVTRVVAARDPEEQWERTMGRYALLWLLGVPIPILLLIYLFGGLH